MRGKLRGAGLNVLTAEDLVLFKVLASRDRDTEDAAWVIRRLGPGLDRSMIESEVAVLARELPDVDVASRWRGVVERAAAFPWSAARGAPAPACRRGGTTDTASRMGGIYTGLAAWNLLFLAAAFVLGLLRGGLVEPRVHLLAGLFTAIFCCLVHAIVFAHFIGSGKWIREGVEAAGMDEAIVKRTKRFKGKVFPFALFSMLLVVATAVLGGGADSGAISPAVHLSFAIATLALNVVATFMERSAVVENGALIERVAAANVKRVAAGIQATLTPAGALDAARAGGKVFLFLSANTWLAYAYLKFVMRRHDEPLVPYLVASVVMLLLGLRMRAEREGAPPPAPSDAPKP